jgi:hypothetical protein
MMPIPISLPSTNSGEMSRSASTTGCEVRQILSKSVDHFRGSWTYGEPWRTVIAELASLYAECTRTNWDGYGALPLRSEVFQVAAGFAASIPFDVPMPEISASAQGDISFEWAQNSRRIISVAVSDNGEIHFAALNGHRRTYGSFPFDGSFDLQLHDLIRTVLG